MSAPDLKRIKTELADMNTAVAKIEQGDDAYVQTLAKTAAVVAKETAAAHAKMVADVQEQERLDREKARGKKHDIKTGLIGYGRELRMLVVELTNFYNELGGDDTFVVPKKESIMRVFGHISLATCPEKLRAHLAGMLEDAE